MRGPLAAVLWDMDGTIVDSEPAWMAAQRRLVARWGGEWSEDDALAFVGSTLEQTALALRGAGVGLDDRAMEEELEGDVAADLRARIAWRPGALELLRGVAAAGIPQAIATTSSRRLASIVAAALAEHVVLAGVVTGEDVSRGKPHPEPYLLAAHRLGVPITDCAAVEDSPIGLAAAVASGAAAVGVPHRVPLAEGPDRTLWPTLHGRTVEDLRALLR
ncbi:HAD family phosphatase [Rathayibacter sp. SD072]|uniref:HAD family hydrolase n=1 Tax=Rathayibacter sp. SD072 TaxID=2781731 RepID=UPI0027DA509C|nr:HAD family phosphatase [Rathayibacter sp. SD072]